MDDDEIIEEAEEWTQTTTVIRKKVCASVATYIH